MTSIGKPGLNYGHFIIDAQPNSRATVVMDHLGETTVAANVETVLGDGAALSLISVQDWDAATVHVAAHGAVLGRDADYQHIAVNLGGAVVRLNPTVRFAGPGGSAELYGLSFCGDGQHQESRLYVDHAVPQCTSNVVYKSVLDGDTARTVWIGDVRIRPAAVGTRTYELNRNLLLSDGARADSVPNLEIETGEIAGAGHASATGRFDDLQLFYLQSRGIEAEEARRLVVRGFLADVVDRITVQALHDRLMASIDARLGAATGIGGGAANAVSAAVSTRLCALADLTADVPLRVELAEMDVAVVRVGEEIFAIEDVCSHAEVPLSEGEVDGCTIECEMHGSRFDLRTGKPTGPPASQPVPVFATSVLDGAVYADLESPIETS